MTRPSELAESIELDGWVRLIERAPFGVTVWRAETDSPADLRLIYHNPRARIESRLPAGNRIGRTVRELFPTALEAPAAQNIPDAWLRVAVTECGETMDAVPYGDALHPPGWFHIHFIPLGDRRVATVYENVTQQVAARRELEQFADVASHDLQAPLRTIAGFVDLLVKCLGSDLPERPRRFVGHIQTGVVRMQSHLRGLLTYARAGLDAETEPVAVESVLADVRQALRGPLSEAGGRFEIGQLPTLTVPRVALHRILLNLIDNAVKYRDDRPLCIAIEAVRLDGQWQIEITDNGIGIEPTQQTEVFELFRRLHPADRRGGGAGLGLAICRRSVELWGGQISLTSTPDVGTRVSFTVPDPG